MYRIKAENGKDVESTLRIGDVIRLKDSGLLYEYYSGAFEHFGVEKFCHKGRGVAGNTLQLSLPFDFKETNWIVKNLAIHGWSDSDAVIALIKNQKGNYAVIDCSHDASHCLDIRIKPTSWFSDKYEDKKKNFVIRKIKHS